CARPILHCDGRRSASSCCAKQPERSVVYRSFHGALVYRLYITRRRPKKSNDPAVGPCVMFPLKRNAYALVPWHAAAFCSPGLSKARVFMGRDDDDQSCPHWSGAS